MPNKNYIKGRSREYRLRTKMFKEEEWDIIQRSKGSHSPIDLFAIRYSDNKILLIQVKPESMSESAKEKLLMANSRLTGKFDVEFVVR